LGQSGTQASSSQVHGQALRRYALTLPSYVLALLVLYVGAWFKLFPIERAHSIAGVSEIASSVFEPFATVARWGGEEFVVLGPEAEVVSAYRLLQDLRVSVRPRM
jgi:hypothetical protein